MFEEPPKKPRGRPRVDEATKKAKAVARATAYRERRKTDRVEHTIYVGREVDGYLDEIIADEERKKATAPTISEVLERLIDKEHGARFGRLHTRKETEQ